MTIFRYLALITLVVVLAACSSAPKQDDGERRKAAETNTSLGREYMDRGQNEIALEKLKRAVGFDKTYAPAHTMLGVLYESIGQTKDAEHEFRLAVQYDPKDGDVNNNLGAFLCRHGKEAEADPHFVTAIEDPFYSTPGIAMANAGSCALNRGELDKAETYLRQSLKYDQRMPAALLPMADLSYRRADYLRARAFLQRYEAAAPASEESLSLGFRIETALGDEESARRYRDQLRKIDPTG
ncbi:MAG: type IV pilus biogenesis/stability protein PilW [Xanthomonadales bacterium]|nr:type IV pilus biogenesis/stability protein PilW [Xanthomonadales bacterium]